MMKAGQTVYSRFRGVDYTTDPAMIDPGRSPYARNLVADAGGYPEKRPGYAVVDRGDELVYGLYELTNEQGTVFLMHRGNALYRWYPFGENGDNSPGLELLPEKTLIATGLARQISMAFAHGGKLYILDGETYWQFDGERLRPVTEVATRPTVSVSRTPAGTGTPFQSVNLLSSYRTDSFTSDGTSTQYVLSDHDLDVEEVTVTVFGEPLQEGFSVNYTDGVVTFSTPPENSFGLDSVRITYQKTEAGAVDRINGCRFAAFYGLGNDTRVFISGNKNFKNIDWHSALDDPCYFPDDGFTRVGADASAIMGYLPHHDALLVLKENNDQDSTLFVRTAALDDKGQAYFPLWQGGAGVGAISRLGFTVLRDDPLFLAESGVYAPTLSTITGQRRMANRSHFIDARLRDCVLDNCCAVSWGDLALFCVPEHCFVADARQKTVVDGRTVYEWNDWTGIEAHLFFPYGDELFFAQGKNVCRFRSARRDSQRYYDDQEPICAFWSTKFDDDGDFMALKSLDRRGCGVMLKPYAHSSCAVSVRTEAEGILDLVENRDLTSFDFGDVDFSQFTFATDDSPRVVPFNTPVRRYRACRIIVKNDRPGEGFGVYGVIKRYRVVRTLR
ncbi:MAG: hypothetical protein IJP30_04295 [Clostridia bacterium]|nr:hypothetical protein [Clostridia bacterium]